VAPTAILIPDTHTIDWQIYPTDRDGNVSGPVFKVLTSDDETGARTRLLHLPPGWRDYELDWHPAVEEAMTIGGGIDMGGCHLEPYCYLYRPPGVLHGPVYADRRQGATFIIRMDRPSRILRYTGDEFPHRHAQPITTEYLESPFAWYEKLDCEGLPWLDAPSGRWAGARFKWVNPHRETGGGCVMLELPPGWSGPSKAVSGTTEEFVLEGSVSVGDREYGKWGYACRAAGSTPGEYHSDDGALLICWWDKDESH
jgi:hypothetical protein